MKADKSQEEQEEKQVVTKISDSFIDEREQKLQITGVEIVLRYDSE